MKDLTLVDSASRRRRVQGFLAGGFTLVLFASAAVLLSGVIPALEAELRSAEAGYEYESGQLRANRSAEGLEPAKFKERGSLWRVLASHPGVALGLAQPARAEADGKDPNESFSLTASGPYTGVKAVLADIQALGAGHSVSAISIKAQPDGVNLQLKLVPDGAVASPSHRPAI